MKLSCKVIEDLLPIYYDNVCSGETALLVEEHLKNCPNCSRILADLRGGIEIPAEKPDNIKPLRKLQKSYKRMKLRWLTAAILIVAMIPVAFHVGNRQGVLAVQNEGFTQEEALLIGNAFMSALTDGDYARAFSYWDIEAKKHEWLSGNDFNEDDLTDFEADGLKKFCEQGEKIETLGGFDTYKHISTNSRYAFDYRGNRAYYISYSFMFSGNDEEFSIIITENGVSGIVAADGLIAHPLSQLCLWGQSLYNDYLEKQYEVKVP